MKIFVKYYFLGFLIDFFSTPVISAYTSAASLTIGCNQIKSLLGLKITQKSELPGSASKSFLLGWSVDCETIERMEVLKT